MPSTDFFITSLVVVLIPGTGVIYTVSTGLFFGRRASIAAALGCTAGIIPHLTASILGLSAILHMSALAFQTVKYAGVLYLLYMAWMMWRQTDAISFDRPPKQKHFLSIVVRGVLLNILNPKLSIFFLAFLPQFISPGNASPTKELFFLSLIFMVMTLFVFILYGLMANGVRRHVIHSSRMMTTLQRSFAATFAVLGVKLALTEK